MSMYSDYYLEREGRHTIEDECGFATYMFDHGFCYIVDIYVKPEYRKLGIASKYADKIAEIAKKEHFHKLLGSVDITVNGSTESMKVLLAYGFKLESISGNLIFLTKEI